MKTNTQMSNSIESAFIEFHTMAESEMGFDFIKQGEYFGVLRIKIKKTEITQTPILFLFTIDISGSMNEYDAEKNSSKMDYVKQTFKNMLRFFSQQNATIFIRVMLFNDTASLLVDTVQVTPDNFKKIADDIMSIEPDGCTNIADALSSARDFMQEYKELHCDHKLVHVFMSDGDATVGTTSTKRLAELVCTEHNNNIFIGFGDSHNASLLKRLSQDKGCDYQFVNHMESSNLIYGETIHKFLYGAVENPTIRFKNALIYNWKKNSWDSELTEDVFVSETEKIYHILTNVDPQLVEGEIVGPDNKIIDTLFSLPELISWGNDQQGRITYQPGTTDLTRYMFRQEVLRLLFRVSNDMESKRVFKVELKMLFQRIRQYMRQRLLQDDPFMLLLCDDLAVTYKTIGCKDGIMYATARQGSQGNQQTTVSTPTSRIRDNASEFDLDNTADDYDDDPIFPAVLSDAHTFLHEFTDPYDNLDDYNESCETTCCYATRGAIDTLTQINTNT